MWSLIKLFKKRNLATNFEQIAPECMVNSQLAFIDKFYPSSCLHNFFVLDATDRSNNQLSQVNPSNSPAGDYEFLGSEITLAEVQSSLYSMKVSSAPGLDQFSYKIIQALPTNFLSVLVVLYNSLLRKDVFPEPWTHSLMVLIPKPQGSDIRPSPSSRASSRF